MTKTSSDRGRHKPRNLCTICGLDFGGIRAFDLHRIGKHEYLHSTDHPDGRRCLTEAEMLERGMYVNANGRWSQPGRSFAERLEAPSEAEERVSGST
jgi:hypothetical protein